MSEINYRYEDLKELGNEAAVRAAGKYNTKGKEYEVQVRSPFRDVANSKDGDICYWKAGKR